MISRVYSIIIAIIVFCQLSNAQTDSNVVTIYGKIVNGSSGVGVSNLMVMNKTTGKGAFGNMDGSFTIKIHRTDTLIFGGMGFHSQLKTFIINKDSTKHRIVIQLKKKTYELPPIVVISQRELEEIQADIEKLGYKKEDYMLSGVDAAMSPITFLYQSFSKREKSKRKVMEMENEDRKRELLKELFVKYVQYDIIDLSKDEFDDFIDFINVPDEFLKYSTQYDFIVYVKSQYDMYTLYHR